GGDSKRLEVSYLDHRDKRIKYQQLTPWQLIQRLLLHVPAKGVHTVRYYGLYAPAAKQQHQQVLDRYGNLAGLKARSTITPEQVLLYCSTCGVRATVLGQCWRGTAKGNSFIRNAERLGGSGYVQQGVERDLERDGPADSS
ncbi:MAG: transposase, partial [Anaerolineales bacterium]